MRKNSFLNKSTSFLVLVTLFLSNSLFAQHTNMPPQPENQFWRNVQFGGGLGLGFGSGYTDISIAPSAIYNLNQYVALGIGAQYKYIKQKRDNKFYFYCFVYLFFNLLEKKNIFFF